MASNNTIYYFVLIVLVFSLVVDDADAGWKFWKKKNKDEPTTTTVAPEVAATGQVGGGNGASEQPKPAISRPNPATSNNNNNNNPSSTGGKVNLRNDGPSTTDTRGAIAASANPGLAIGIGTTTGANGRGQRPTINGGTDVGLDIRAPAKVGTEGTRGQGYRDWAADLTGAGQQTNNHQPPKVPSPGPALTIGIAGQQPKLAPSRPAIPTTPAKADTAQQPGEAGVDLITDRGSPQAGTRTNSDGGAIGQRQPGKSDDEEPRRPGTTVTGVRVVGQQARGETPKNSQGSGGLPDGNHVSSLNIGSLNPGQKRSETPSSGYQTNGGSESSGSGSAGSPSSTGGGKSWAQVAGNGAGNSKQPAVSLSPIGPSPPTRSGSVEPPRPGQQPPTGRGPTRSIGAVGDTTGRMTPVSSATGAATAAAAAAAAAAGANAATSTGAKVYSSNPTYSKGNTVTDDDLEKLAEALFIKDNNNANRYITINLQKQTTGSNTADQAPQPLLSVNPQALQIPTIEKVISIYDNYKLDTRVNEYISPAQRQEESLLVDTFLSTNVMSAAMRFLADKGFVAKDYYAYKDTLRRLWFNLYSRGDGKIGSAGFEHVFLTELKLGTEVSGLHNWIYFNAEEVARRADYLGYIKKLDLGDKASIIKFHTKFNNIDKPVTTMFIGTSPELEMALYTVCFFARPERPCPLSLGGTKFNVVTHKFKYRGKDLIGSAYPEI